MSVTLGGVQLSGSLIWEDRNKQTPVAQTIQRTLGGSLAVYHKRLIAGRPVTLIAREDTGWITKAMLDAIESMAETAGGVYTLDYHGFTAQVMFRHHEAPAVSFTPLTPKAEPEPDDFYIGELRLFTV